MHRYILRKQRIAPGYLTRVEIIDEVETNFHDKEPVTVNDVLARFGAFYGLSIFNLAPGEQLIIHNAGDD